GDTTTLDGINMLHSINLGAVPVTAAARYRTIAAWISRRAVYGTAGHGARRTRAVERAHAGGGRGSGGEPRPLVGSSGGAERVGCGADEVWLSSRGALP